jgi:hypothetical protein
MTLKQILYFSTCFLSNYSKDNSSIEKTIESHVDFINKNKKFSFNLYTLKEGNNLSFNIGKNEFLHENKKFNISHLFKSFLGKSLSSENKKRKGLLNFSLGDTFNYSNTHVTLNKIDGKLIGKKNNIPFFKKTYNISDFIGVFILMKNIFSLDKISYVIQTDGDLNLIVFYRKESTGIINNFMIIGFYEEGNYDALLSIDGEYHLFRIENNIPAYKDKFN